ncbi:hypothetical protein FOZ61_008106 [Perkinsus olseni]|uniref:Uncharacterized protein n=1 Tax=Perkinsus olseni TaxID=32597 RepID=A0A7J6M807_PEROL|nr:hypothetical protein FOZ61_008106 [Perkinsus olseni]
MASDVFPWLYDNRPLSKHSYDTSHVLIHTLATIEQALLKEQSGEMETQTTGPFLASEASTRPCAGADNMHVTRPSVTNNTSSISLPSLMEESPLT